MSLVDIRAIVTELNKNIGGYGGYRLANFYDLASKAFLLKFSKSESEKIYVVIESGMRLHSTKFEREKNQLPSNFTAKVRKYIRTRRCSSIKQLGIDRIVDFTFGSGEQTNHLIAEFYAQGNMILTDANYKILAILRPHSMEENVKYAVGELYPTDSRKTLSKLDLENLFNIIKKSKEKDGQLLLKNVLNLELDYGPSFALHCMTVAGFSNNITMEKIDLEKDLDKIKLLLNAFHESDKFLEEIEKNPQKGYIVMKEGKNEEYKKLEKIEDKRKYYDEFHPFNYLQFKDRIVVEFNSFDASVDEFFAVSETETLNTQKKNVNSSATKKLEKKKNTQEDRVKKLQNEADVCLKKAQLIEYNSEIVDKAIEIVSSAKSQGINWEEIKNVIKEQKEEENPIALIIQSLKLEKDEITLLLTDPHVQNSKPEKVEVNVTMSALSNVKIYYETKKRSEQKKERTLEHTDKVLKLAEEKTKKKVVQQTQTINKTKNIQQMRKRFWFEKFNWFITSENYLVLSGRDAQQNDILIKRYMRKGDIYVHADIHGASSCVIKNPSGNPIPRQTLIETGIMTVCRSSAWNAKITANAWWVYDHQVSKTAPSGEYLSTGSFMIRGKKNFLGQNQMMMCLSIMFKLSDESVKNHIGERKVQTNDEEDFIQIEDSIEHEKLEDGKKIELFHQSGQIKTIKLKEDVKQESKEEVKDQVKELVEKKEINEKRKLTPKDRKDIKRLMKKGINEKEATDMVRKGKFKEEEIEEEEEEEEEEKGKEEIKEKDTKKETKRGKKSKLKKIQEKYKEQDEEERELRMQLLGHKKKEVVEEKKEKTKEEVEEILKKQKEEEEIKKLLVEENLNLTNLETNIIDTLTANPKDDDVILYAIPVCGPYATLRNNKYKVKLVPGNLTRGKAAKMVHNQLLQDSKDTKEHQHVKALVENLYVEALLGNVKPLINTEEKIIKK